MRLYDNAYPSTYEEIKTWYPVWYRDVLEMDALWRVWGRQLDEIQAGIIRAIDNNFIDYADAETLSKLEEFFHISYDGPRTLDERRALVSSFFIGNGHIGEREIKEIVGAFTAGDVSISLADGGVIEISVTRDLSDCFNLSDCFFIISKRIPAHLSIFFHDILLPIRFVNIEHFIFEKIDFSARFYNGGNNEPILLDGRAALDGSWTLSQKFRGVLLPRVSFKTSFISPEAVKVGALAFLGRIAKNYTNKRFEAFKVFTAAANNMQLVGIDTAFSIGVKQTFSMSASLVTDSMYELDGSVLLDGSRKLNANIIKEDI